MIKKVITYIMFQKKNYYIHDKKNYYIHDTKRTITLRTYVTIDDRIKGIILRHYLEPSLINVGSVPFITFIIHIIKTQTE